MNKVNSFKSNSPLSVGESFSRETTFIAEAITNVAMGALGASAETAISKKRTCSQVCKEEKAAYQKAYKEAHKEERLAKKKLTSQKHKAVSKTPTLKRKHSIDFLNDESLYIDLENWIEGRL
jgi:hypothetical protein